MPDLDDLSFTAGAVADIMQMARRKVLKLAEQEVVIPSVAAEGSGRHRGFSFFDLLRISLALGLARFVATPRYVRQMVPLFTDAKLDPPEPNPPPANFYIYVTDSGEFELAHTSHYEEARAALGEGDDPRRDMHVLNIASRRAEIEERVRLYRKGRVWITAPNHSSAGGRG